MSIDPSIERPIPNYYVRGPIPGHYDDLNKNLKREAESYGKASDSRKRNKVIKKLAQPLTQGAVTGPIGGAFGIAMGSMGQGLASVAVMHYVAERVTEAATLNIKNSENASKEAILKTSHLTNEFAKNYPSSKSKEDFAIEEHNEIKKIFGNQDSTKDFPIEVYEKEFLNEKSEEESEE